MKARHLCWAILLIGAAALNGCPKAPGQPELEVLPAVVRAIAAEAQRADSDPQTLYLGRPAEFGSEPGIRGVVTPLPVAWCERLHSAGIEFEDATLVQLDPVRGFLTPAQKRTLVWTIDSLEFPSTTRAEATISMLRGPTAGGQWIYALAFQRGEWQVVKQTPGAVY